MKIPVSDDAVNEYAQRVRNRIPLGEVFPAPMSDCDFTKLQRELIRKARSERKALDKGSRAQLAVAKATKPPVKTRLDTAAMPSRSPSPKAPSKLSRMLYLQSNRCFFCGESLAEADASIEHLNPKSRGGKGTEDNVVVCHKSLNETFGNMDLKSKFAFVLKSGGSFKCPKQ